MGSTSSPIYQSPFVDQGYDISDYYKIAEEFGTMEEFDELLAETKKRGMYVLMDLVVNHCSDKHEWFQKAFLISAEAHGSRCRERICIISICSRKSSRISTGRIRN